MIRLLAGVVAVGLAFGLSARAQDAQSLNAAYYTALKGKKVGFVPIAMGFNETQAWRAAMERQARELGYEIVVRDPNWSIESGIQAINSLIAEKPDLMVIENIDDKSYNRLVKRSMEAGIPTIQVQQRTQTMSDAYMGPDWHAMGVATATGLIEKCGTGTQTSHKVAIVQGALTAPASLIQMGGVEDTLKAHPEVQVVANQAADWDATKAYSIASTIVKQHPDICGIAGFWDVSDVGIAGAVREATLQGKVAVVTSGGGSRESACDKINAGDFTVYHSYNVAGQARDLNAAIKVLLQTKAKPGSQPFALISPLLTITKETMTPSSCWTLREMEHVGG